jgi:hypothetical protein
MMINTAYPGHILLHCSIKWFHLGTLQDKHTNVKVLQSIFIGLRTLRLIKCGALLEWLRHCSLEKKLSNRRVTNNFVSMRVKESNTPRYGKSKKLSKKTLMTPFCCKLWISIVRISLVMKKKRLGTRTSIICFGTNNKLKNLTFT